LEKKGHISPIGSLDAAGGLERNDGRSSSFFSEVQEAAFNEVIKIVRESLKQ